MSSPDAPLVIPRLPEGESVYKDFPVVGKPGWWKTIDSEGRPLKPIIRCNCGHVSGIGLHHVHADGRVTQSFYHKRGNTYPEDPEGCEWHEWLKLADWDMGDIPPDAKRNG
jgi:hypothetical protein